MSIKFTKLTRGLSFAVSIIALLLLVNNANAQTITETFEEAGWAAVNASSVYGAPTTVAGVNFTLSTAGTSTISNSAWSVETMSVLNTSVTYTPTYSTTNATTTSTTSSSTTTSSSVATSNAYAGSRGVYLNGSSSSYICTPIFSGGVATVTLEVWPNASSPKLFIAAATSVNSSMTTAVGQLTSCVSSASSGISGIWSGSMYTTNAVTMIPGQWNQITFTTNIASTVSNAMLKFQRDNTGGVVIDNIVITQPTAVTPAVALSSSNPAVAAANLPQNTTGNEIYDFSLTVSAGPTTLTSVTFTTTGTYVAADITNFKLLYHASTDVFTSATQELPTLVNSTGPGTQTITLTTPQGLAVGTYYFYLTADVPSGATAGNTLTVSAITTANLGFSGTAPTLSGTAYSSGLQTITAASGGIFYNKNNSDVSVLSNWGTNTDGSGTAPSGFNIANCNFYLINGATNTLGTATNISGASDSLFIGDSTALINVNPAALTMATQLTIGASAFVEITTKGTLTVNNYLLNSGSLLNRGTMSVGTNATYEHAVNGSSIPTATWGTNSTCLVSGSTSSGPGNGNQAFYNLTWNCTGQTGNYNLAFANNTIAGNLTVTSTGSGRLNLTNATVTPNTITISGNLNINGAASFTSCGSSTPTGTTITMNITGNITTVTGSTLDLENGAGATSTWNLSGNLTNGGTIKGGNNTPSLHFSKGSGTQSLTNTGSFSTIAAPGGLFVDNGSTLDLGANLINGGINFTLSSGGTLETNKNTGLNGSLTTTGTITLSPSANYIFDGTTAQVTGALLTAANNVTINNAAGVTLSGATAVSGVLSVANGNTFTTNNYLTLVSNSSGTASVASTTGTITGSVTVQRYIPANANREWRLLSVPTQTTQSIANSWQDSTIITNTTLGNGFDGPAQIAPSMLVYTPGNPGSWNSVSATTDPIATTSGYIIYIRGNRTVLPSSSTTGTTPTTLTTYGPLYQTSSAPPLINVSAGNFALIGNLYASAIDFTQITKTGGIDTKYYVWDPKFPNLLPTSLGGYIVFSSVTSPAYEPVPTGGGGYSGSYTSGVTNTAIQSGQAFFVHASSAGTVQLTEASKTTGNADVFRPASPANISGQLTTNLYRSDSTGLNLQDGNVEVFNSAYSDAIDGNDALKLSNLQENFGVQRDGSTLVIEARQPLAATDSIYFNMWNMNQTQYQLQFTPLNLGSTGLTGYLQDSYLNTVTPIDLTNGATVNFTVDANAGSSASNRFLLVFNNPITVPVTFAGIQASQKNTSVAVNWQVAGQSGIKQYEVERSSDGVNFNVVGTVAAANSLNYSFIDATPANGNNFYRIISVGVSGEEKYSSIVKVDIGSVKPGIAIYPNPVTGGKVGLQLTNMPAGTYNARLLSITGQELYRNTINHAGGSSTETLSLPVELAKGIYKLEIVSPDNSSFTQKLILN